MDSGEFKDYLITALPLLARISGGYATVTDREGRRIKTVDSNGNVVPELDDNIYDIALEAARQGKALVGPSQIVEGAEAWALPVGDYVLCASNIERFSRERRLKSALAQALPLIARAVGGEAVLFDKEGKRLACVNADGTPNDSLVGKTSEAAREVMESGVPGVGESLSVPGAVAVRIPISENYGLGISNENTAVQKVKILEELKKYQTARYSFEDIVGGSEIIRQTKKIAAHIANGISSVLISGETGTGKELFAQAIHNAGLRRTRPFVAVNCGALPASLVESCIFGYEEGAFTGARRGGSPGVFEQAHEGTVFLDEISEMDIFLQSRLLRVLQEREVTRIGGNKTIPVDVRVIASTNKNLLGLVRENKFREDLFFRLNVVELKVPPLRERLGDISVLARYFIQRYNTTLGKFVRDIHPKALEFLQSYPWPGNVRELQNCLEYALNIVTLGEQVITIDHLPPYLTGHQGETNGLPAGQGATLEQLLKEAEKSIIMRTLEKVNYSRKDAAALLGVSTTTLWRRMSECGLGGNRK